MTYEMREIPGDGMSRRRSASLGRVVALDVGSKRIGVAACDPDRIVTRGAGVIAAHPLAQAYTRIAALISHEEAVEVIVGYPLTLRGEVGPQAKRIEEFVEGLQKVLDLPIILYDERLTSSEARRLLEERGPLTREDRRQGRVDELAARLLLDDYLQEQRLLSPQIIDRG